MLYILPYFFYLCAALYGGKLNNMKKHTFKSASILAAAMPIAATLAFLFWKNAEINWQHGILAIVAAILLQSVYNFIPKKSTCNKGCAFIWLLATVAGGLATSFIATGAIDWSVLTIIIPVGLITDAIMHSDKKTMVMGLGEKPSAYIYFFEIVFPYVWIAVCSMAGILPIYMVLVFMTLAVGFGCATTKVKSIGQGTALVEDMNARTSNLQIMFSVLLCISLVVSGFIK